MTVAMGKLVRFAEIVKSIAINKVLSLQIAQRLVTRTHVTGIDGDVERSRELFEFFAAQAPVKDKAVLELGPGKTLATLQLASENGCSGAIAADVTRYFSDSEAAQRGVKYILFDGRQFPLPDASVDIIWAHYCMQHFRDPSKMTMEMARVLRPGGRLLCRVDLRDHYHMFVPGREYDCLQHSEALWRNMAWNRSSYVNRLRVSEWISLFSAAGFSCEELVAHRSADILTHNRSHGYLKHLSDGDIETYRFDARLVRPLPP